MGTTINQPSMTSGELAEALYARVELAKYQVGLKRCYNCFVQVHGGVSNRPGLEYVDVTKDSTKTSRLIPFQFNTQQTYALEFGDQYMRVIKDGARVLEPDKTITNITQANPGVVSITSHGYSNGDEVDLSGVVGMTEVNGKRFTVNNVTTHTFELSGVDTTSYTAYSSGGVSGKVFTLGTPYLEADLPLLKIFQSADVLTVFHTGYAPREITRTDHHVWTITNVTYGATIDAPTGLGATPSGSTANYVVTAVDADGLEESLPSSSIGGGATPVALSWAAVSGASKYNVYKQNNGGVYGFIGSSDTNSFTDNNIAPTYSDTPPTSSNPFNAAGDYPATGTYHQQRLVAGQTNNKPERNWMSQSANFKNFNRSTPAKANDAIIFTINAKEVQEIRHYIPLNELLVFTSSGEWLVRGANSTVLDATELPDIKPQSAYGASNVPPLLVGKRVLFIEEIGNIIRDFFYRFEDDGFDGKHLSIMSEHFFEFNDMRAGRDCTGILMTRPSPQKEQEDE